MASFITGSPEETNAYLQWLLVRTQARLTTFGSLVEVLATTLIAHRQLTGAETKAILTQASTHSDDPWGATRRIHVEPVTVSQEIRFIKVEGGPCPE
jgi:hypothetical protein